MSAADRDLPTDAYYKKDVALRHGDTELRLRVSQDLFSSHEVDEGTRHLLRSLAGVQRTFERALDLGCGYGAIGLALRASGQAAAAHLVDRDALAVEYARQNAAINRIVGVEIYGSLGYDDVRDGHFDLIASNVPAKAGASVIEHLLLDAASRLRPDGLVAIVVIDEIAAMTAQILRGSPNVRIVYERATHAYTVFHYEFDGAGEDSPGPAFQRGVYDAGVAPMTVGGRAFELETAHGLAEAGGPSFETQMLIDALVEAGPAERALALNPSHGYVPAALALSLQPQAITLADRDLLALRISERNLRRMGGDDIRCVHGVGLRGVAGEHDLIAGVLRDEEGAAAHAETLRDAARVLAPTGRMVIAASSTATTRLEKAISAEKLLRINARRRKKGWSVLSLSRR